MVKYVSLVKQLLKGFLAWKLEHITRDCNEKADALVIRAIVGVPESTIFINLNSFYCRRKATHYSGSRVEHKDVFSSYKMICSDSKW